MSRRNCYLSRSTGFVGMLHHLYGETLSKPDILGASNEGACYLAIFGFRPSRITTCNLSTLFCNSFSFISRFSRSLNPRLITPGSRPKNHGKAGVRIAKLHISRRSQPFLPCGGDELVLSSPDLASFFREIITIRPPIDWKFFLGH